MSAAAALTAAAVLLNVVEWVCAEPHAPEYGRLIEAVGGPG
jgi:hypothetical protein